MPARSEFPEVSYEEFAVLAMTNSLRQNSGQHAVRTYTSKESYVWAYCICRFLYSRRAQNFDETIRDFESIIENELIPHFLGRQAGMIPTTHYLSPYSVPLATIGELFHLGRRSISSKQLVSWEEKVVKELEKRGLIGDPLVFGVDGSLLFCLGLLPFSFTIRTNAGDLTYAKIQSILWDFEYSNQKEKKKLHFHFKVEKLVTLIKQKLPLRIFEIEKEKNEIHQISDGDEDNG